MKLIVSVLYLMAFNQISHAKTFTCVETEKSQRLCKNGATIKIELNGGSLSYVAVKNQSTTTGTAQSNLRLNERGQASFIDFSGRIGNSQAEEQILIGQEMLNGQPGIMALIAAQSIIGPNPMDIWFVDGEFNCK